MFQRAAKEIDIQNSFPIVKKKIAEIPDLKERIVNYIAKNNEQQFYYIFV